MLKQLITNLFLDGYGDCVSLEDVETLAERLNDADNTSLMTAYENQLKARFAFLIMHKDIVDYDKDYVSWAGTDHESTIFVSQFKKNAAHSHNMYKTLGHGANWLKQATLQLPSSSQFPHQSADTTTFQKWTARCVAGQSNFDPVQNCGLFLRE